MTAPRAVRAVAPARTRELPARRRLVVVLTSVASDAHTWNLIYLQLLIEEFGHEVVNLGPCVTPERVIEECTRWSPDLVVVSTVNGHGLQDGISTIRRIRSVPALRRLPVVIGGQLRVSGPDQGQAARRLVTAGFDAAYNAVDGVEGFRTFMQSLSARPRRAVG